MKPSKNKINLNRMDHIEKGTEGEITNAFAIAIVILLFIIVILLII